jgi:hypothetical protein
MSEGTRTLGAAAQEPPRTRPGPARRAGLAERGRRRGLTERGGVTMSIGKTRGSLYRLARILGDVQAVRKGRVGKRIGRRVVGRHVGRGMGRLFR